MKKIFLFHFSLKGNLEKNYPLKCCQQYINQRKFRSPSPTLVSSEYLRILYHYWARIYIPNISPEFDFILHFKEKNVL